MQGFRKSALAVAVAGVIYTSTSVQAEDINIQEGQISDFLRVQGSTNVSIAGTVQSHFNTDGIRLEGHGLNATITINDSGEVYGAGRGIQTENTYGQLILINSGTISGSSEFLNNYYGISLRSGELTGSISNTGTGTITGLQSAITIGNDPSKSFILNGNIENDGLVGGGSAINIFNQATINGSINNYTTGNLQAHGSSSVIYMGGTLNGSINNAGTIGGQVNFGDAVLVDTDSNLSPSFIDDESSNAIPSIETAGAVGIVLNSNAVLSGNINNTGDIFVSNTGIDIYRSSTINGDINNSGTITSGKNGVSVYETNIPNIHNQENGVIDATTGIKVISSSASIINDGVIKHSGLITDPFSYSGATFPSQGIQILDSFTGNVYNTGSIETNRGISVDHYSLENETTGTFTGAIINSGNISTDAQTLLSSAISISNTAFTGDITNSGQITGHDNGVRLDGTSLTGTIQNSGSIETYDGIDTYDSTINGDIINSGRISSGTGIGVYETNIDGSIINTGEIHANNSAIWVSGEITGGIVNTGDINGSIRTSSENIGFFNNSGNIISAQQNAISFYYGEPDAPNTLGTFLNTGSIIASGYEATGVNLGSNLEGNFINTGRIATTAEPTDLFAEAGVDTNFDNYTLVGTIPYEADDDSNEEYSLYHKEGTNWFAIGSITDTELASHLVVKKFDQKPTDFQDFVLFYGEDNSPLYLPFQRFS